MGYKEDLEIDKLRLDFEWLRQPSLYMSWGEKEIEAQFEKDKLKEQLELKKAELDTQIRKNPKDFGLGEKVTESAISNCILQNEEYKSLSARYLESVKVAKTLGVAVTSFEHKKKSLETLSELWISGYWADPRIKKETREEFSSMDKLDHLNTLNNSPRLRRRMEEQG